MILICLVILIGMSFMIFTDKKNVVNHLRAGDLDVTLTRTNLEYTILGENGTTKVITVEEDLDLTDATEKNAFGFNSDHVLIVPGNYFKADLQLKNSGNIALEYTVGMQLISETNALAEQVEVTVTDPNGLKTVKRLSEMLEGVTVKAGEIREAGATQSFTVEVRFIDDTTINNAAQTQMAVFDLVVNAQQLME